MRPFEACRLLILPAVIDILELQFFFNAAYLLLLQFQLLDLSECLAASLLKLECQTFLFYIVPLAHCSFICVNVD